MTFLYLSIFLLFRILVSSGRSQPDNQSLVEDFRELVTLPADWPTLAGPLPVAGSLLAPARSNGRKEASLTIQTIDTFV